jgi:hypothetical protein
MFAVPAALAGYCATFGLSGLTMTSVYCGRFSPWSEQS